MNFFENCGQKILKLFKPAVIYGLSDFANLVFKSY